MSYNVCLECGQPVIITPKDRHRQVVRNVAGIYGYTFEDIAKKKKQYELVVARHHCYSALNDLGLSLSAIGRLLDRDHTTVLHGIKQHRERLRRANKKAGEPLEEGMALTPPSAEREERA